MAMNPTANVEQRLGKYFLIRSKSQPGLVLEVKDGSKNTGSLIVLGALQNEDQPHDIPDHQLWFWNHQSSTIRCKLTSYCISCNDSGVLVSQLYTASEKQQWSRELDKYLILKNSDKALSVKDHTIFVGASCEVVDKEGLSEQQWAFTHIQADFFFIHHRASGRVMDIRGDNAAPGSQLITYPKKEEMYENQLWWEDEQGVIHSGMHDYVIKVYDNDVCMYPYDSTKPQRWVLSGSHILNIENPSMVLDVKSSSKLQSWSPIVPATNDTTQASQEWTYQVLKHQPFALDHDGTGKYFLIKQPFFDLYITASDSSEFPLTASVARLDLKRTGCFRDEQLFFHDTTCHVIRSKMNEKLCLEIIDSFLALNPYEPCNPRQELQVTEPSGDRSRKIHLKKDLLHVLTLGTSDDDHLDLASISCYLAEDFNSHHQRWQIVHGRAPNFYIQSKSVGKVLEVKRSADLFSCTVTLADRKIETRCALQLWYEDQEGLIRSHFNGFVLDTAYGNLHTDRFNSLNQHQGWVVNKGLIRNKNTNLVLDIQKKWLGYSIEEAENKHSENQCWNFLFV